MTRYFLILLIIAGCASKGFLKVDNAEKVLKIEAYDKGIQVTEIPGQVAPTPSPVEVTVEAPITSIKKAKPNAKQPIVKATPKPKNLKKEPDLEDAEGFIGRRPVLDPFRIGEKATLKISYFNVAAGEITLEVKPFVQVDGRKSYHFFMTAKSNSLFSSFYSVNDSAETFVDYDQLIPFNMAVHIQESKQLREIRALFDWKKKEANFWDKKVTSKGVEEKEKIWSIPDYSQNMISAAYYMRTFTLKPGKEFKFRLADEKKNMVVTGKVLRREKLQTDMGELDTIVIQPEIAIDNVFKPMGDVYFWLTDDDRKFLVRIESKIKIGTIVAKIKEIKPE